jgi:hypothetical protein
MPGILDFFCIGITIWLWLNMTVWKKAPLNDDTLSRQQKLYGGGSLHQSVTFIMSLSTEVAR